jgi:hypothetical protein
MSQSGTIQPFPLERNWGQSIETALESADAAIFLVGPGFFASRFITSVELQRPKARGSRFFPLVVEYCMYTTSALGAFQAFNNPEIPME